MSIRGKVLEHMKRHPSITVSLETLAGTYGFDQRQVQQVMSWALRRGDLPGLEVVEKGRVWKYLTPSLDSKREFSVQPNNEVDLTGVRPNNKTFAEAAGVDPNRIGNLTKPLEADARRALMPKLEQIDVTKGGDIVLQDDLGNVWIARRVYYSR